LAGTEALIYGVPIYHSTAEDVVVEIPFFKLNLNNEALVNAYKYLAFKFGQYLLLEKGVVVKDYDPLTGRLAIKGSIVPKDVRNTYEHFVREYLVPKLKVKLADADLDEILPAFYYKKGESNPTGLSPVILPAKHLEHYFDALAKGNYAIQRTPNVLNSIEMSRNRLLENLRRMDLRPHDLVIVDKRGDIEPLSDDDLARVFLHIPESDVVGVKRVEKQCIYCGATDIPLLSATGKLGVGRTRLPHEETTDLSGKAKICLRCILISLLYTLDAGGDFFFQLSGFSTRFRDKRDEKVEKSGKSKKVPSEGETLSAILTVLSRLANHPRSEALVYNSLFGDERVTLGIEGLDEEVFEKLALLYTVTGKAVFSDEVQSLLISYVNSPSFSDSLRILLHILKKQSEKAGVRGGIFGMSYVSKYITSRLYIEKEDKRVAYTLAKLASSVVWLIGEKEKDEKTDYSYEKRRFADTFRRAGLSKALAYAVSATKVSPTVLVVLAEGEEKDIIRGVLSKYGFRYIEEGNKFKVYADSIALAEIKIEEKFTPSIYEDAYTILITMRPEIELK